MKVAWVCGLFNKRITGDCVCEYVKLFSVSYLLNKTTRNDVKTSCGSFILILNIDIRIVNHMQSYIAFDYFMNYGSVHKPIKFWFTSTTKYFKT